MARFFARHNFPATPRRGPAAAASTAPEKGGSDAVLAADSIQEGESVNGSSQVNGDCGWSAREGRVVGKISGSSFSFNETHPLGSPPPASCSAELEGTLELHEIARVVPPRPPYPSGYPINPPSTEPTTIMSGFVKGSACGKPLSGMITLFRN